MDNESHRGKLKEYLRKNLAKGYTSESLKWALVEQGYSRTDIARAMDDVNKEKEESGEKSSEIKEKPVIKYEIYDKDNKPINVGNRKSFSLYKFFRSLFS